MKHYYLLLGAFCTYASSFGQKSNDILTWTSLHPDVYLMSSETYNSTSQQLKDKLAGKVLIYDGELTMEVIEHFDQSKSMNKETPIREDEAQEIKDWLGQHPDLKIIPRSFFDSLNATEQQVYAQHDAMILIGETVTLEDIRNY